MKKERIHFVGIGGTGTGSLAVALVEAGHEVSGSDGVLYEPMKSVLMNANIRLLEGYRAENAKEIQADVVIIGNVIRKDNVEAQAWIQSGTRFVSFPEAVRSFIIQDRRSIVCAGTHGKTSTTTWIAYLLTQLGMDPTYLIGGVPKDLPQGCKATGGDLFVGEGDEYDSAFFDKGPKFLHYHPHFAVISCIEFDHADIYRDLAHVKSSFEKLVALLPGDGLLIARFDDPVVMEVAQRSYCPVQTFGKGTGAMWRLGKVEDRVDGATFEAIYKGRSAGVFETSMLGEHNYLNLLSGIVAAVNLGVPLEKIRPIVATFSGARRRQEVLLKTPVTLVDDFAHHPTEVLATLTGVRKRFPNGKLWALFEPRSATARRNVHQDAYETAFAPADHILASFPFKSDALSDAERFSSDTLVDALKKQGKDAQAFANADEIVEHLMKGFAPDDVVVVMSNGEFGKIQDKLKAAFKSK